MEAEIMQALAGIKVLDFSKWLPGQYCGMVLADYGADVIKVESIKGDTTRGFTPIKEPGLSYWHLALNRNKRDLTVNLKSKEGPEIVRRLAKEADVLLEGFRPGFLETLGLGWEDLKKLNPRLIFCSVTGFGDHGPYCHLPAHDLNVIGLTGLDSLDDVGQLCLSEVQISALGSSLNAVSAIALALFSRERTGRGQKLEVNLYATALSLEIVGIASRLGCRQEGGSPFGRYGSYYNVYRTKDGRFLTVGTIEPKFWQRFCQLINLPDLASRQFDFAHEEEIIRRIAREIGTKTLAQWQELIGGENFCVTPVLTLDEALGSDLTKKSEMLMTRREDVGPVTYVQPAFKMSGTPGQIRFRAPKLGEHNREILGQLGYSAAEITSLETEGAVGKCLPPDVH